MSGPRWSRRNRSRAAGSRPAAQPSGDPTGPRSTGGRGASCLAGSTGPAACTGATVVGGAGGGGVGVGLVEGGGVVMIGAVGTGRVGATGRVGWPAVVTGLLVTPSAAIVVAGATGRSTGCSAEAARSSTPHPAVTAPARTSAIQRGIRAA